MNSKNILIVLGEPFSVFSEIIAKYFTHNSNFNFKIIIIGNLALLKRQLKKLNYSIHLNKIKSVGESKKKVINIIDINFENKKTFSNITNSSNIYMENCFNKSLEILKKNKDFILINGPVSKKSFLKKKFLGVTEYIANKTSSKNEVMLIYNDKISVSPITTHIPIKHVAKKITKEKIISNIKKIENFYKLKLKKRAKFAVLGLNPHCETTDIFSEEERIINPAIKRLKKKGISVDGPFSADTFFLEKNIKKYNVVIGMYHDQVLTPLKTLFKFNAINLTIGLPFIRISPDHGPNVNMAGKNISDPTSLYCAINFIKKLK